MRNDVGCKQSVMAAQRGGGPSSSQPAAAADHSVLVVVGALQPSGPLDLVLRQIEAGERILED